MSTPFFFEPVVFVSDRATVPIPTPDGGTIDVVYEAGEETWVDGGMLRNFPIDAFDRIDGRPPRWPTIGIKLSSLQMDHPASTAWHTSVGVGLHCLETMMNEWDSYSTEETTAARTNFVDNCGIKTTDFELTYEQKNLLLAKGRPPSS